jgi:hypothetical protein
LRPQRFQEAEVCLFRKSATDLIGNGEGSEVLFGVCILKQASIFFVTLGEKGSFKRPVCRDPIIGERQPCIDTGNKFQGEACQNFEGRPQAT